MLESYRSPTCGYPSRQPGTVVCEHCSLHRALGIASLAITRTFKAIPPCRTNETLVTRGLVHLLFVGHRSSRHCKPLPSTVTTRLALLPSSPPPPAPCPSVARPADRSRAISNNLIPTRHHLQHAASASPTPFSLPKALQWCSTSLPFAQKTVGPPSKSTLRHKSCHWALKVRAQFGTDWPCPVLCLARLLVDIPLTFEMTQTRHASRPLDDPLRIPSSWRTRTRRPWTP